MRRNGGCSEELSVIAVGAQSFRPQVAGTWLRRPKIKKAVWCAGREEEFEPFKSEILDIKLSKEFWSGQPQPIQR